MLKVIRKIQIKSLQVRSRPRSPILRFENG